MHGSCRYGKDCQFSHDMGEVPSMVCKYYLAGHCSYGDKCRYDHKRPAWSQAAKAKQAFSKPAQLPRNDTHQCARQMQSLSLNRLQDSTAWDSGPGTYTSTASTQEHHPGSNRNSDYDTNRDSTAQPMSAWQNQTYGYYDPSAYGYSDYGEYFGEDAYGPEAGDDWDQLGFAAEQECTQHPENEYSEAASDKKPASRRTPSEQALCSQYQVSGHCPRGTDCHMAHGDLCQICGRYMLHPHNEQQQKEHSSECQARHDRLAALRHSQGVECCVCLERVLDKPTAAERKFGLLSCEHAFCLGCIRGWRSHHEGGADTDTALRTCPLCRTPCWFVTPSSIWPANQEDKDRIVAGYKAKLGSIDCRHWNFGENTCPFGTSCFYRHIYPDGPPQEAVLRKYGNSEGEVKILQPVRLSDFIQISSQRRPLRGIR
ncbi:MAG: E3 ubiquitin- ligase makorin-like [Trebouxia sp. A1-2]|nr:MAG: E3 ubiquitin- ligase makorin-like [Trebouxia sp. A1-2]